MGISDDRMLELDDLWAEVRGEIRAGKRAGPQIADLKAALQFIHEDRLGVAVSRVKEPDMSREAVLAFCDRPVGTLCLPQTMLAPLGRAGIRLGGELFRVDWITPGIRNRVRSLLIGTGFPEPFDPIAFGWRPKYFDDPAVRAALSQPWIVMGRDLDPWNPNPLLADHGHFGGMVFSDHYLGTFFRRMMFGETELAARNWQHRLDRVPELAALHAAMYVPDDWTPPAATCPEWDAFKSREERAKAFAAEHGRPNGMYVDGRLWSAPGAEARRGALARALQEEGMSPHFFDRVLFEVPFGENGAYFSRHSVRRDARTVRAFLALSPDVVRSESTYWPEIQKCLAFWGLRLGMTEAELDEFLGPEETAAAGA